MKLTGGAKNLCHYVRPYSPSGPTISSSLVTQHLYSTTVPSHGIVTPISLPPRNQTVRTSS